LRLKILKNLRTASLSSEFTGSYKKCVTLEFSRRLSLDHIDLNIDYILMD